MANDIQLKRSSVAGRVPAAANVLVGEPVINLIDKIIFTKDGGGNVIVIGAGTTSNVIEGSNLYFSNARVSTAISSQTLGNATFSANVTADRFIANNNGNAENYRVGDDAWIGDTNVANTIRVKGIQDFQQGYIAFGNNDGNTLGRNGSGALTYSAGFAAANVVSTGNVSAGNAVVTNALTAGTLQTAGNVNANNLRVVTNSSLGTVVQGTWNGSSISTTYTDAKIVSVSNTAPISATTTSGAVTLALLNSGVSAATYGGGSNIPVLAVDAYGRITSASNVAVAASSTSVFTSSTTTVFPGHSGNVDYGDLSSTTADAFGVSLGTVYDCMEPIGSLVSEDLEVL